MHRAHPGAAAAGVALLNSAAPAPSAPRWRARLRVALLLAIVALYAASIPWYRAGGAETGTWWGLPTWVMAALVCYALVAVLNALAWLLTDVPDVPGQPDRPGGNGKGE